VLALVVENVDERTLFENERPFPSVSAPTAPVPFVDKMDDGVPESVRLVVLAVPKNPVPETVSAVVEAPPCIEKRPLVMVEEALERKPEEKVPRLVNVLAPVTPIVPVIVALPAFVKLPTTVEEASER